MVWSENQSFGGVNPTRIRSTSLVGGFRFSEIADLIVTNTSDEPVILIDDAKERAKLLV